MHLWNTTSLPLFLRWGLNFRLRRLLDVPFQSDLKYTNCYLDSINDFEVDQEGEEDIDVGSGKNGMGIYSIFRFLLLK